MIVSEIRLRFNKFATMKIKSYKDGNQVKKYVSSGEEKKAIAGTAIMAGLQGAASLGSGLRDYFVGKKEADVRSEEINRLKATAPSLETPAAFRQAVKDAYDRSLFEAQQREITRQLGTSVGALQQAGGRALLGGIGAATQQAALSGERAAQAQAQTQLSALTRLGQAELQTQGMRERRFQRELAAQRELRAQAERGAGAGLGSAIGGGIQAGLVGAGFKGLLGEDIKKALKEDYTKKDDTDKQEKTTTDQNIIPIPEVKIPKTEETPTVEDGVPSEVKAYLEKLLKGINPFAGRKMKKGGVMKTKGEFSHKKNPIDLVQDGRKVGEATGGEYIFNPEQAAKMYELAEAATGGGSKEDKSKAMESLAKFVKTTLERFEKDLD